MILFGRDQSLICLDRSALVLYLASLDFDWFSELEPEVDEVSVLLVAVWESDDKINFEQWGVVPKESTNEEGDGKLNENYDLHFEFRGVVR